MPNPKKGKARGRNGHSTRIEEDDSFVEVVRKLCVEIEDLVEVPYTFEQLKGGEGVELLGALTRSLMHDCAYHYLVSALL